MDTTEREKQLAARLSNQIKPQKVSSLSGLSRINLATLLILYIFALHLTGLYTFTKGFLLSRVTIPTVTPPYTDEDPVPIPATHSKAVFLIIDALRTDFISPYHPIPSSPFHHGVLTLPAKMTAAHPKHSLIFNTFSDPPTTTMQRIKGLTTGSLPTFVDAGSNFASTAIEEDSWISQLVAAGKNVGFMGDDTWGNLFPTSFNLSHPYDSFNVEDLHTVDNGVIEHLIPYLHPTNSSKWDVLIGHFLGVDHVGHRVGPYRDTMRIKLEQMDKVLANVVELLDEETLLIVLGDHGMDSKGNHGGDSEMETSAALWMYSKGQPLSGNIHLDWPTYTFPGTSTPLRHINQIDLVPTLSLLLGLPIPFNNLGSIIPECFARDLPSLELATRLNAEQIMRYISAYGETNVEKALATIWGEARASVVVPKGQPSLKKLSGWLRTGADSYQGNERHSIDLHRQVTLQALEHLRILWAQFSPPLIILGLTVLGLSVPALLALYVGVSNGGKDWDVYIRLALETAAIAGGGAGSIVGTVAGACTREPLVAISAFIVVAAIVSEIVLITPLLFTQFPRGWTIQKAIGPIILLTHAVSFASNSFVMWEDRVVLFLIVTIPIIHLIKALTAPTASMRVRIISLSISLAILVRLAGSITTCREEQQPYCRVTFFSGLTASSPKWAMIAIIPFSIILSNILSSILKLSKSYSGPAPIFIKTLRLILIGGAIYWILEWAEHWQGLQPDRIPLVQTSKLWLARITIGIILGALPYLWTTSGLCIEIHREISQTGQENPITVYGFANSFGSTYLLFLLIFFALFQLLTQTMGQLAQGFILLSTLIYLESVDTQKDSLIMLRNFSSSSSPATFDPSTTNPHQTTIVIQPSFSETVLPTLLGFLGFFTTGHQAVLTSIQWKAAFVGFSIVTYPFSPILVILNTWGSFFLSSLSIPLLAFWNISPKPSGELPIIHHSLLVLLSTIIYHTTLTLASAVCAAWLRRHLMVWKVFAPRFMLAGVTLLVVDLGVLLALTIGVRITCWKVWKTFKSRSV